MEHVVRHNLGRERAKLVAERAFATYAERYPQYNPQARWTSDADAKITFTVKGVSLEGTLKVKERFVELALDVPFLFRPFKNKAIGIIEREIKTWMAKAEAGEL